MSALAAPKALITDDLYERDYFAWTVRQGRLLREGRLSELDLSNVAEEIESLGRSDRRAIGSHMIVLVTHLLKWAAQPEQRSSNWRSSIAEARYRIGRLLKESPSLRRALAEEFGPEAYDLARGYASGDTGLPLDRFPEAAPFTVDQALDRAFLPGPTEPIPR